MIDKILRPNFSAKKTEAPEKSPEAKLLEDIENNVVGKVMFTISKHGVQLHDPDAAAKVDSARIVKKLENKNRW